jgi:hypothetical protein
VSGAAALGGNRVGLAPSAGGVRSGREAPREQLSGGPIGLPRSSPLSGAAACGRSRAGRPGRSARATRPPVAQSCGLYAPARHSGGTGTAAARRGTGRAAGASSQGHGAQAPGLSLTHSRHGDPAPDSARDRGPVRHHDKPDPPAGAAEGGKRWRRAGTATVPRGACSRGGLPRGAPTAGAHALGGKEP